MKRKTFKIKLTNDNGHITGAGTCTLSITAPDREAARKVALKWAEPYNAKGGAWRLHDTEREKV